jgi:hypothetical protein
MGLGKLASNSVAFQFTNIVDEQFAIQMIDLVLNADGEQAVCL